jgi:adenylate kinase family enzyme
MSASRWLILGNSGSGKSWLASKMATKRNIEPLALDEFHWLPGGFNERRAPEEAMRLVREAAAQENWIMEGVFGWLANEAAPRATALLWLQLPEEECVRNLRDRPVKNGETTQSRRHLEQWCLDYRTRENANSYAGHLKIHEAFPCEKHVLASRLQIEDFLSALP